jgi:hypothetical protein
MDAVIPDLCVKLFKMIPNIVLSTDTVIRKVVMGYRLLEKEMFIHI